MKKFKPVSLKTTVLGRKGRLVIHTPLSINSVINCAIRRLTHPKKVISTPGQSTEEDIAADYYEVSVIPPETSTSGANYTRNVSSVCNWEKERAKLVQAIVEEEGMPESPKLICVICNERLNIFALSLLQPLAVFLPKVCMGHSRRKKPIPCFGQCKINVFGTVMRVWNFSAITQSPQETRTCISQENIMKTLVFLLWSLLKYVLTCLVGVEDCKTECSRSESDLLYSELSRPLPTFIGERSAASTCRIFVMLPFFNPPLSILLTSVNRQSVYQKNCSLSQKEVIGYLDMLNIALINVRFWPTI